MVHHILKEVIAREQHLIKNSKIRLIEKHSFLEERELKLNIREAQLKKLESQLKNLESRIKEDHAKNAKKLKDKELRFEERKMNFESKQSMIKNLEERLIEKENFLDTKMEMFTKKVKLLEEKHEHLLEQKSKRLKQEDNNEKVDMSNASENIAISASESNLKEKIPSEKEKPSEINLESEMTEVSSMQENKQIINESKAELNTESEMNQASSVKKNKDSTSEPKEDPPHSAASDQEEDDFEFEPEPSAFSKKIAQIQGMDRELKLLEDEKLELELDKRIIIEQIKRETDINFEHQDKLVLVKGESDAFMKSVEVYGNQTTSLQEKVAIRKFELITQAGLDRNLIFSGE